MQTHRDPVPISHSLNSLIYTLHRRSARTLDLRRMAEVNLSLPQSHLERNLAARERHPNAVYDVRYDELVRDPVGVVKCIYAHYGLPFTEAYEEKLQAYVRENPRGKHGRHRYGATDVGLADAVIAERFATYARQFGLTG